MLTERLEHYFDRLFPICRSITGNGLRQSFHILQEVIPLELHEVPTGTACFDWTVPREWNIEDAYILRPDGKKICDFQQNNLHVVNYSIPQEKELTYEELLPRLHTIPDMPTAIPYVTSYYRENWGFCLTHEELQTLPKEGTYKVVIKSSLAEGSLTYGDLVLKGETDQEVLISTYLCHPSMANNELSGPLVAAFLYEKIKALPRRKYTYRFIFAPETIGVIAYLSKNGSYMKEKTVAGYVLTCCGDAGDFVYKKSKRGNSLADRAAMHLLQYQEVPFHIIPFAIGGSDERQYCSPGFNMPVGSLTRSIYQRYKEYHTSLDNKDFISFDAMEHTIEVYFQMLKAIELNEIYVNKIPYCEPQLGKRGLYPDMGAISFRQGIEFTHNLLHFLTYTDGEHDLIDLADKRNRSVLAFEEVIARCKNANLI
ncbi:MAG: DUF4910 domain-containing protein [Bacteroidia bacterium]